MTACAASVLIEFRHSVMKALDVQQMFRTNQHDPRVLLQLPGAAIFH
jgi:hypothetical protein